MKPELMQCNEVVTPLGVVAFFAVFIVGVTVIGLLVPWMMVAFERYGDWVEKKTGGWRG